MIPSLTGCPGVMGCVIGPAGPLKNDNIKENWDGWKCDVQINTGIWKGLLFGHLRCKGFLADCNGDVRIIFKIILAKYVRTISIRFIWLMTGTSFGLV